MSFNECGRRKMFNVQSNIQNMNFDLPKYPIIVTTINLANQTKLKPTYVFGSSYFNEKII